MKSLLGKDGGANNTRVQNSIEIQKSRRRSLEASLRRSIEYRRTNKGYTHVDGGGHMKRSSLVTLENSQAVLGDGSQSWMIKPTSMRKLGWDIVMMSVLIYVAIVAPYR